MSSAGPLDAEDISRCSAAVCSPVIEVGRTYFFLFLDTQVSPAPTHVSQLVGQLVTLSNFQSLVAPEMMHRG